MSPGSSPACRINGAGVDEVLGGGGVKMKMPGVVSRAASVQLAMESDSSNTGSTGGPASGGGGCVGGWSPAWLSDAAAMGAIPSL